MPFGLLFTYVFKNGYDRAAFLFDRLFETLEPDGRPIPLSALAGVMLVDGRVVVSKRLQPVPPNMAVEVGTSRVEPGATFQEQVVLPLAAVEHSPYVLAVPYLGKVETYPADFEPGFFLAYPGREGVILIVKTIAGPMPCLKAFSDTSQIVLRVGPLTHGFKPRR